MQAERACSCAFRGSHLADTHHTFTHFSYLFPVLFQTSLLGTGFEEARVSIPHPFGVPTCSQVRLVQLCWLSQTTRKHLRDKLLSLKLRRFSRELEGDTHSRLDCHSPNHPSIHWRCGPTSPTPWVSCRSLFFAEFVLVLEHSLSRALPWHRIPSRISPNRGTPALQIHTIQSPSH